MKNSRVLFMLVGSFVMWTSFKKFKADLRMLSIRKIENHLVASINVALTILPLLTYLYAESVGCLFQYNNDSLGFCTHLTNCNFCIQLEVSPWAGKTIIIRATTNILLSAKLCLLFIFYVSNGFNVNLSMRDLFTFRNIRLHEAIHTFTFFASIVVAFAMFGLRPSEEIPRTMYNLTNATCFENDDPLSENYLAASCVSNCNEKEFRRNNECVEMVFDLNISLDKYLGFSKAFYKLVDAQVYSYIVVLLWIISFVSQMIHNKVSK